MQTMPRRYVLRKAIKFIESIFTILGQPGAPGPQGIVYF